MTSVQELAAAIRAGDRTALARGITLVESRRDADSNGADTLLQALLPHAGRSVRIGITGAPGVGKSTLIDTLGQRLCDRGHKIAVLAVDPSSTVTGGSILGDKTRMTELSRRDGAFIRPSPGGEAPGGVAARTREAILLCEAAGHDVVLVETIGTGQSETAVHGMVDFFLLMLSPGAGDELQGIKRGVMELADAVLVHKADGELAAAAERAASQCELAVRVLHGGDTSPPPVLLGSSTTGRGIDELWSTIEARLAAARAGGTFDARRRQQVRAWFDAAVRERLLADFLAAPETAKALDDARERVHRGDVLPGTAARELLRRRHTS